MEDPILMEQTIIQFIKTINGLSFYPQTLLDLKDGILFFEIMEQVDPQIFDKSEANDKQACEYNWQMIHHNLVSFRKMLNKFFKNVLDKPFDGDKTIDLLTISERGDEQEIIKLSKFVIQAAVHNVEFVKNIPLLLEEKYQVAIMKILQEPQQKLDESMYDDQNNIQHLLLKIDSQEQEIKQLQLQNDNLLQQKNNLENNSQVLAKQLIQKEKTIEQMNLNDENKLEEAGLSGNDDFIEAIKIKDQKLQDLQKIHDNDIKEKNQEIQDYKEELKMVEKKYKEMKKFEQSIHQYQELKEEIIYIKQQKQQLEQEFNQCQRDLADKEAHSIKITDKYKKLQDEFKAEKEISLNFKLELSSKSTQMDSINSKLNEYKERYYSEEQKAKDLQSQLDSIQEDSMQLSTYRKGTTLDGPIEDIIKKQDEDLEQLKLENQDLKEKINKLEQDDPEILKHELKIYQNKYEELQQENIKLQEQSQQSEKSEKLERELAKEKESKAKLQQIILKAKETVKKQDKELTDLKNVKLEKDKLEQQNQRIPKLIADNNQLKKQIKVIEDQNNKKIKDLQDKIQFQERQQGLEKTQKEQELASRLLEKQDEIEKQDTEYQNQILKLQEKFEKDMQEKIMELEKDNQEAQALQAEELNRFKLQSESQAKEKDEEIQNLQLEIQSINMEKSSLVGKISEKEQRDSKRQSLLVEKEELLERKLHEKDQKHKQDLQKLKGEFNNQLLQEKEQGQKTIDRMKSECIKKLNDKEQKHLSQMQEQMQINQDLENKFKQSLKQELQDQQEADLRKSLIKTEKDAHEIEGLNKTLALQKQQLNHSDQKLQEANRFNMKLKQILIDLDKNKNEEIMLLSGVLSDLRNRYQEIGEQMKQQQKNQFQQSQVQINHNQQQQSQNINNTSKSVQLQQQQK